MNKLPETMSPIELEEAIENHDCKLKEKGYCDCVWLKQILLKRTAWGGNIREYVERFDKESYV